MADQQNQPDTPTEPEEKPGAQEPDAGASTHTVKSGGVASYTVAIVVAVLFAVALIGLGIVLYGEDETQQLVGPDDTGEIMQENTEEAEEDIDVTSPVKPADIDQELDSLDAALEEFNNAEYDESELSDEALGL